MLVPIAVIQHEAPGTVSEGRLATRRRQWPVSALRHQTPCKGRLVLRLNQLYRCFEGLL